MTTRDQVVLAQLRDYYQTNRIIPSFAVIAELAGMKSTSNLVKVVERLKEEGFLKASSTGRLAPAERFFERQHIDPAVEPGLNTVKFSVGQSIDALLVKVPSRTVLLQVKDDAMAEAGVLNGDWVVVQRGAPALPGQLVAAIVDNTFCVRYLDIDKETDEFFVRAAGPGSSQGRKSSAVEVFGRVMASYRTY